ncbi:MAG: hypothetical protein R3C53_00465 [Pirellulaceae bacterium]
MSQATLSGAPPVVAGEGQENRICHMPDAGWERWWVWASERVNPIVVKEIRQSLKSKQFTLSFGLTLIVAIAWTLLAISLMVPKIFYLPGGATLLTGFFCILCVPLLVIIPFSAFRSLTAETEDSTFELLSISALSSHQIIYGKMASACLQIVLYLSALAPCIVLTYLLRGISLFSILFLLGMTLLISVSETAVALLLAAVSRTRMVQTGASVLVLAGLVMAFFGWTALIVNEGLEDMGNPPREAMLGIFAFLTIVAVAISVVLRAAAAAIDFPSENHSTSLRWRILGLVSLFVFWMLMLLAVVEDRSVATAGILVSLFVFFMFIGGLVCGERGIISLRGQRTLPKTFLGRIMLTWFYPGAGLGYIYIVCIFGAVALMLSCFEVFYVWRLRPLSGNASITATGYLLFCYLVIYLGITRLAMLGLGKSLPARMLSSVAMLVVILLFSHLVPWMLVFILNDYRDFPYAAHQAFNIYLSVEEANDRLSIDIGLSILIVTLCASGIFGLNLLLCTRDIMLVRVALPPRLREEDGLDKPAPTAPIDPFAD